MVRTERRRAMDMKPGDQFVRHEDVWTVKSVWVDGDGEDGNVEAVHQDGGDARDFHFGEDETMVVVVSVGG